MPPIADVSVLSSRYRIVEDWRALNPEHAEAIRRFWRSEGAILDEAAIERRLPELVVHAEDADGNIAAVSTVYSGPVPQFGQTFYHYRCFVGKAHRSSYLMRQITVGAINVLERHARSEGFPCVGVIAELENPRFRSTMARVPVWRADGVELVFVGKSPRGLDVRVHYFRGARLQVAARAKGPVEAR